MTNYILRLDDACEKRKIESWNRIESILDKYKIRPLVGVIPNCEDPSMDDYEFDYDYENRLKSWVKKGWTIALHGYNHVYSTKSGGINPVNFRSEFAGEPLEVQKEKIREGLRILKGYGIKPKVFFAPSHTFDEKTLVALLEESDIRIISDTIAYDSYTNYGFTFVPQQTGKVRSLPFKKVTFCYHPNTMRDKDFEELEEFIFKNSKKFIDFPTNTVTRRFNLIDWILKKLYFLRRK
ncbi:DUF2334 domain-containing protein [uncultured Anaerococcus sp.]|uniref:DUF2334 domain-containing protein n=1 Tax=uncultured Anaerococcus sp. TaxID=293428 RepID=UPI00288BA8A2|nr:DUF2334 domain-containing protein [uncultured Anaerococcus sp.]